MCSSDLLQWLGLHASTAGGAGSIPGWRTGIPHAVRGGQKKEGKNREKERETALKTKND